VQIDGIPEEELIKIIQGVAARVGSKYRFGYHSKEDMIAQAVLEGIKILQAGKFTVGPAHSPDEIRKRLRGFLTTCISNRMSNYVRDHSCRYASVSNKYNTSKYNIMHPIKVGYQTFFFGDSLDKNDVELAEVIRFIRSKLSIDQVKDFIRIQNGVSIPAARKTILLNIIKEILHEAKIYE
jgi:hypothetical protein